MTIGERIKEVRKEKGWTQKQLGKESGINEVQIRRYELNNSMPTIETLQKIADALDVKIIDLVDTEELVEEVNNAMQKLLAATEALIPTPPQPEKIRIINKALEKDGIMLGIEEDGGVSIKNKKHMGITCVFSDDELNELYESIDSQIRMAVTKFILDKQIFWLFDANPERPGSPKLDTPPDNQNDE